MLKIKVVCATGLTSNLLVNAMQREAEKANIQCEIAAGTGMNIKEAVATSDVVVLGPAYGYKLEEVNALASQKCAVVTLKEYEYASTEAKNIVLKAVEAYKTLN